MNMDFRKKELYEVFADSLEKSRTKEGGLLFDKLFEDMWEHIEPKLGQSLPIDSVSKRFWHFDCWDRTGKMQTITIEALNEMNATIIFKAKNEDLGFDPPY